VEQPDRPGTHPARDHDLHPVGVEQCGQHPWLVSGVLQNGQCRDLAILNIRQNIPFAPPKVW